ncbi:MAG: hypothetical protein ACRCYS_13255 [Beijerinckiaceae bacterium]
MIVAFAENGDFLGAVFDGEDSRVAMQKGFPDAQLKEVTYEEAQGLLNQFKKDKQRLMKKLEDERQRKGEESRPLNGGED